MITGFGLPSWLNLDRLSQRKFERPELVVNGDGSSLTGWSGARGVETLSLAAGRLRATSTTATTEYGIVQTLNNLVVGRIYKYSVGVLVTNGASATFRISTTANLSTGSVTDLPPASVPATGSFVASATTLYIGAVGTPTVLGQFIEIDDISVK